MTTNGGHDVTMFHVYGWKGPRMADGPYYLAGATSELEAIEDARQFLRARSAVDPHNGV